MIDTKFFLPMPATIDDITAIIERDMPKTMWMVGPDGITGGPVAVGDWQVEAHGNTPIEALMSCYALAMEKMA